MKTRTPLALWLSLGISVIATVWFAFVAHSHSWFYSDDYLALSLARTKPFIDFLMTPIDVHFLPLHRLATWLIYNFFPLNFDVALVVMCAFHLAGVWMLYRTLELIGESSLNGPLTALSGANFYAALLLLWWTVGIARFPYVLFSLATIYQYLKFRQEGSVARVVALVACAVCATAFFTKGLLIPGFLGALELALLPETPRRKAVRNLGVVLVATLVAFAYYKIAIVYGVDDVNAPPFDWNHQLTALWVVVSKSPQSLFALQRWHPLSFANWVVCAFWLIFLVVSIRRDRFNAVVWVLGLCVLVVHFLVITLSPRMEIGPIVVAVDRYYFENLHLIAIFVAVIGKRMRLDEWLANLNRGRVPTAGIWVATGLFAIASQLTLVTVLATPRYAPYQVARTFGWNLKEGIAALRRAHQGTLGFVNGYMPIEILAIAAMEIRDYSEILPIFDRNVVVVSAGECLYAIRDDGTIRKPPEQCP